MQLKSETISINFPNVKKGMKMEKDFHEDDATINDFGERIKHLVKELALECPMKEPLNDCPLAELRKLPLNEKLTMIQTMPANKLYELLQHHYDCFEKRNK